jgi:hypothetical protein
MKKNINTKTIVAQGAAVENIEVSEVAVVAETVKKETKVVSSVAKVAFFAPLIQEGKFTADELTKMALEAFPKMTESTIRTFLTDAKNVKYNKFEKLVVLTADKKLAFAA